MSYQPVGKITHFFGNIKVAVVEIDKEKLVVGDRIRVEGKSTRFHQKVSSMQVESRDVKSAIKGNKVGLKVVRPVKVGDLVLKKL